jgi:hypothetical protein
VLKTVRLELARTPDHPLGDPSHAYIFRAPIDSHGQLEKSRWEATRAYCTVKRIESGTEAEHGLLIAKKNGQWAFSYQPGDEDDESLFRFGTHRLVPGEYLSITEHDGVQRTFKVTAVTDWSPGEVVSGRWPPARP